jgi:hypothetical protein
MKSAMFTLTQLAIALSLGCSNENMNRTTGSSPSGTSHTVNRPATDEQNSTSGTGVSGSATTSRGTGDTGSDTSATGTGGGTTPTTGTPGAGASGP